jgi:NDP-sugar pyrophosphorylase family protein
LESQKLINTINQLENYEEVSEALILLKETNPEKTLSLVKDLLENSKGDVFLRCFAFDILYSLNIEDALSYAESTISEMDAYMLSTVINNVTSDSAVVEENESIRKFVALIKGHLKTQGKIDLEELLDSIKWFNTSYSDVLGDSSENN